jgi:hypothetical protein
MCEDLASILQERGESVAMRTMGTPTAATLPPGTALPKLRRRRRGVNPFVWVGGAVAAVVLLFLVLNMGGKSTASGSVVAPPAGTGGLTLPPSGPTETKRVLRVTVPDSAVLKVGAVEVGRGSWFTDTMPPGKYSVTASIPGRAECPTTTVTKTVTVGPAGAPGIDTVSLTPRECGMVTVALRFSGAAARDVSYTLQSIDWRKPGTITRRDSLRLLVPVGVTQISLRTPLCADIRDPITVPKTGVRKTYTLMCGPG